MTKAQDYEKIIRTYMSRLGKKSHQKSPRDPEHFKRMQAASVAARLAKKMEKIKKDYDKTSQELSTTNGKTGLRAVGK